MFFIVISVLFLFFSSVGASISAVKAGANAGGLAKELYDIGVYGSKRAIFVRNRASDVIRVWCASADDSLGEKRLNPGESLSFAFNPLITGGTTVFWCTAEFRNYWARWDSFGRYANYLLGHQSDKAYEYEVRNDGVYYLGKKIRGLDSGHNRYTLWDHYDGDKNPHGQSLVGFVDGGMCNNLPGWMETKVSAVTVCDRQCVILFSELHCSGETSRLQAEDGCTNFWLSFFNDRARSVKGC